MNDEIKRDRPSGGFAGRTVLVAGAAGGIGSETARLLHQEGARVVLTDRSAESLTAISSHLPGSLAVAADLRSEDEVTALFATLREHDIALSHLVAAAGVIEVSSFLEISREDWDHVMDTNLTSMLRLVQESARLMSAGGSMALIASSAARIGRPQSPHYGASKAGVVSLAKSAAVALAPGIRVNAVCPGPTGTAMWASVLEARKATGLASDPAAAAIAGIPLGKFATPVDIAETIAFFLSDKAGHITGQALYVDGGSSA